MIIIAIKLKLRLVDIRSGWKPFLGCHFLLVKTGIKTGNEDKPMTECEPWTPGCKWVLLMIRPCNFSKIQKLKIGRKFSLEFIYFIIKQIYANGFTFILIFTFNFCIMVQIKGIVYSSVFALHGGRTACPDPGRYHWFIPYQYRNKIAEISCDWIPGECESAGCATVINCQLRW